ncbi:GNAT family N-acetyltransferase [Ruminococcaceae bacterium OttesenSCG-928-L11]|nr:GNAT family N-acetyltransferase [Ruminococcaceae bacterium OttesenSCG-928-L11]
MQIVDFTPTHCEAAIRLNREAYRAEQAHCPDLPNAGQWPELTSLAQNGLGVAAVENGRLLGYLCAEGPFGNAFRSTQTVGVFSPLHAHSTIPENREKLYGRLYQAAGEKWARAGAHSHGISLYAHDEAANALFYRYGFGIRCVDAVKRLEAAPIPDSDGYTMEELPSSAFLQAHPLMLALDVHMAASPTFILRRSETEAEFLQNAAADSARFFVARQQGQVIAMLKTSAEGETFLRELPGYTHITGAYTLPEYRGKGVAEALLRYLCATLYAEGYRLLGVDCESINPAAYGFWQKHFDIYTHGIVRRIDGDTVRALTTQ